MKCSYCGKEIDGKPMKIGPKLVFCDKKCYVMDIFKEHKGTSLEAMCKRIFPEVWEEYSKQKSPCGKRSCEGCDEYLCFTYYE